ncbi:MAG: haloacid dehalogenase type II [Chloroflexi bacterium]|nr:haloacid dehalogenase type II [Chloroflexota bacterium]
MSAQSSEASVGAVFFDLFGTLLSLAPLDEACDQLAPGRGGEIAARWRARQLEATWLRTVMDRWANFDVVTRDALAVTLHELGVEVPPDRDAVTDAFVELPLADGAAEGLRALHHDGMATGVLTNASRRTLDAVAARLDVDLGHLVSVDPARRFKPHPSVYQLAVDAAALPPERIGFVTANGWDAAGAGAFGMRVAWLRPSAVAVLPAVGGPDPTITTWSAIPSLFAD